ncbi:MAG: hypothetical protein KKA19_09040 [Candidatus Margulisbacteria bacterium]|nr:hypothetical protein [Candidatus Margulisiibacteriota bacterium]
MGKIDFAKLEELIGELTSQINSREKELQILQTREELENRLSELDKEIEKIQDDINWKEEHEEKMKEVIKKDKKLSMDFRELWGKPLSTSEVEKKLEAMPHLSRDNAGRLVSYERLNDMKYERNKISIACGRLAACRYNRDY